MAKRYSGNLQINVVYDDKGFYRTAVSSGGKLLWRGTVNPAPSGFGPGIAYDSSQAYDEIARSALAFADDEKPGIADEAESDENLTGYQVRRSPPAKRPSRPSSTHHLTKAKKTGKQLDREIHEALGRKIHQQPTGREVYAAHQRGGHITTSGRRALTRAQFALPPGPDEKRRGLKGRLPIDTIERARDALARASMMHHRRHITARELAQAKGRIHGAWPSIALSR